MATPWRRGALLVSILTSVPAPNAEAQRVRFPLGASFDDDLCLGLYRSLPFGYPYPPVTKGGFDSPWVVQEMVASLRASDPAAFERLNQNITWPPEDTVPAAELRAALARCLADGRCRRAPPPAAVAAAVSQPHWKMTAKAPTPGAHASSDKSSRPAALTPAEGGGGASGAQAFGAGGGWVEVVDGPRRLEVSNGSGSAVSIDAVRRVVYVVNLKAGCTSLQRLVSLGCPDGARGVHYRALPRGVRPVVSGVSNMEPKPN